jgi:hypothetical protein
MQHTATLLNNGKVLIVGGSSDVALVASAELYDTTTGKFASTGSMTVARTGHTATLLGNGKVLVASGWGDHGLLASAELYDPATEKFTPTGDMTVARGGPTATSLGDGTVLFAGGYNGGVSAGILASAELYDPATGKFTATGSMTAIRVFHTATLLQSQSGNPTRKVLIAGGFVDGPVYLASAELYDPAAGKFAAIGNMTVARTKHTATLLSSGNVLLAGGAADRLASAELYAPASGKFTPTGSMTVATVAHTATALLIGKVLIAGGAGAAGDLKSAELYDPGNGEFTATGSMTAAREDHTATLLPSGTVLIAGGWTQATANLASAELYQYP